MTPSVADGSCHHNCCHTCSSLYGRAVLIVQKKLNMATGAIGAFVARHPVWTVVLSILIAALAGGGWARFKIESESDKLW